MIEYRIVKTTYRNSIELEDGPGSLRNIVARKSEKVIWSYQYPEKDCDSFEKEIRKDGFHMIPLVDDESDGWVQYSYELQKKTEGSTEWKYVQFINANCRDCEDWYRQYD